MSVKALPLPETTVARIHAIAGRHGVVDVRLFGSHARGEADPGSDLDLLIRLEPGRGFMDFARSWRSPSRSRWTRSRKTA